MIKIAVAYSSFLIGFMLMFMILFSDEEVFNSNMHTHFLGVIGKVNVRHVKLNDTSSQGVSHDDWGV